MDYPKLATPICLGLVSSICFLAAKQGENWPEWIREFLAFCGIVMAVGATVTAVNWMAHNYAARLLEVNRATAMTERTMLLDKLQRLSAEQIGVLNSYVPVIEILGGAPGPIYVLRTGDDKIPMTFIEGFINRGDGGYLCPVGTWSEGSREREWATSFTRWVILLGFAEEASGNRPARWVNVKTALQWIGLAG